MSVPAQEPITQQTGNGVTTSFAYQFLLALAADLEVSVNGVSRFINTDYALTGLGSPAGGTITFNVAPLDGAVILFVRAVALQRDTNYQYSGDFQSKAVNADFDRLWMAKQDLYALTKRSIKLPPSDGLVSVVLPKASMRANKALVFDAAGAVAVSRDDYNDQAMIAAAQALIATTKAGEASVSAASARTAQTAINHKYRGALDSDPATRTDGEPNQAGDEYFSTPLSRKKVYSGTGWYLPEDPLVAAAIDTIKAFNNRGAFETATTYALKDVYLSGGIAYVAVIAHVSTSVAADLAAGKVTVHQGVTREELAGPGGASTVGNPPLVGAGSTAATVAEQLAELQEDYELPSVSIDGEEGTYKSEPKLLVTNTGKILAVYRHGADHVENTGILVYRVFNRAAKDWGPRLDLDVVGGKEHRNHIVGKSDATGRLFVIYVVVDAPNGVVNAADRITVMKYSDDDGLTWSERINISQYCPYPGLDNVPYGKLINFSNCDLMFSFYNYHTILTLRSTDNGATWGNAFAGGDLPNVNANCKTVYTTPHDHEDNSTEPCLVRINDVNLVCMARCIPTGLIKDGTVTWRYLGRKWLAMTRYEVDMVAYEDNKIYRCTVAGTSSAAPPAHTAGSADEGTVTWLYLGLATPWAAGAAYANGSYITSYSTYLQECDIAGTSGASEPFQIVLDGNETRVACFKSQDGGLTWGAAIKTVHTSAAYQVSTSPPIGIVVGGTVYIAWYTRTPEFTLYLIELQASAFFENPGWAFEIGGPRKKIMRSYIFPSPVANGWRIDVGYADVVKLPWSRDLMVAWYDKPILTIGDARVYSTVIRT